MKSWWCRRLWILLPALWAAAYAAPAGAVQPSEEVLRQLKATGRFEAFKALDASARRRGVNQPDSSRLAASAKAAVVGNLRALVILVEFSDNLASGGGSFSDSSYFNHLLFSTNTPGTSMNDHYREMSYGLVSISGETVNWLTAPQTYAYYVDGQRGFGSYPHNAQKLAEDAVDAAEAMGVDFSLYDNDGDGELDGLFIVHAGPGYEATGDLDQIHSHQWVLNSPRNYDGVTIWAYTMEPEEQGDGRPENVGVFSHEFGHFLGLPDLYDTDYTSAGLGFWCLMASGSWGNGGAVPTHFSIWCKYQLGWVNPTNVTINTIGTEIPQVETDSVGFRLWQSGAYGNQYFLVENRQRVGFDLDIPGEGLCIYHIDDAKYGNDQEWYPGLNPSLHFQVAIEQSDGDWDLEHDYNSGDGADPWPGAENKREFSEFSAPNSKAYGEISTQIGVWNISDSDSLMTANLDIYFSQPHFDILSTDFGDDGNGNGRPDPGENVTLVLAQRNLGAAVTDAQFSVSADDTTLVFVDSTAFVGPVATGATGSNSGDPFMLFVPAGSEPRGTDFYLTVTADGGAYRKTDTLRVNVGPDQVLIVDDDARLSIFRSYDSAYIMPVLDSLRVPYAGWEVKGMGTPTNLQDYPMVLWYTGDARTDPVAGPDTTLTPSERLAIANYLDGGGHLWLTGQQIAYMLDVADSAFMHNYLHAAYDRRSYEIFMSGVDGDLIGDQTKYVLGGAGGAGNQGVPSVLTPVNGAIPVFQEESNPARISGVRFDAGYKLLFLGWGVEGIGDDIAPAFGADPKSVLIGRVIDWMVRDAVPDAVTLYPLAVNPGQDASHLMDTAIDMHWNYFSPSGDPQDSLELQVGADADWTTAEYWTFGPLAAGDTMIHYGGPTATVGQTYYWRVRVFSGGVWSNWGYSSWHMNAAPPAPIPDTPTHDEIATQNGPVLRTHNALDPEGDFCLYDFEVYADSTLTVPWAAAAGISQGVSTTAWTVATLLPEQGRAWWRVRATDGYFTGPWSSAESFYVDGINEPPTAATLDAPADGEALFSTDLALAWSGATDPDLIDVLRYLVRVDTQATLTTPLLRYDSLETESLVLAGVLEWAQTYYWNVVVLDKGGLQAASPVQSFRSLLPGDVFGDGQITTTDIIFLVNFIFKNGPAPDPLALGDVNASCDLTSSDIIYLVLHVFKSGPQPQVGCAVATPSAPRDEAAR